MYRQWSIFWYNSFLSAIVLFWKSLDIFTHSVYAFQQHFHAWNPWLNVSMIMIKYIENKFVYSLCWRMIPGLYHILSRARAAMHDAVYTKHTDNKRLQWLNNCVLIILLRRHARAHGTQNCQNWQNSRI